MYTSTQFYNAVLQCLSFNISVRCLNSASSTVYNNIVLEYILVIYLYSPLPNTPIKQRAVKVIWLIFRLHRA